MKAKIEKMVIITTELSLSEALYLRNLTQNPILEHIDDEEDEEVRENRSNIFSCLNAIIISVE